MLENAMKGRLRNLEGVLWARKTTTGYKEIKIKSKENQNKGDL